MIRKLRNNKIIAISLIVILFFIYNIIGRNYGELVYSMNRFFGADNQRAIEDMVIYSASHYRTSVHPLFVILTNPIGNIIEKIVGNTVLASVILNSLLGAAGVGVMYLYTTLLDINKSIKICVSLVFAFGASTVLFSAIPETFSFGTLSLLLMYYIGYKIIKDVDRDEYTKSTDRLLKVYFPLSMVLCFGITITNYMQSVIVLCAILYKIRKKEISYKVKKPILCITFFLVTIVAFVQNNIFAYLMAGFIIAFLYLLESEEIKTISFENTKKLGAFIIVFTVMVSTWGTSMQKCIFQSSGLFFSPQISEELNYVKLGEDKDPSVKQSLIGNLKQQVKESILPLTVYSAIAPEPELNNEREVVYSFKSFKNYTSIQYIALILWIFILIFSIFMTIKKTIYFNYFILTSMLFNLGLHTLYGSNESFIYSGNMYFLFILLMANSIEKFKLHKNKYKPIIINTILSIVILLFSFNNIAWALKIKSTLNTGIPKDIMSIEAFNLPEQKFFMFGMGNRKKIIYKNFKLIDAMTGETIKTFNGKEETIIPEDYTVKIKLANGEKVEIIEDENAVWLIENGEKSELTSSHIVLPRFEDSKYSEILRILHHEILINVVDGKIVPNFLVYDNPWYRDSAMASMVLKQTGNIDLIRDWILNLNEPYDKQNAGVNEPDNLGEALYMISLASDKNHPLVNTILEEANRIKTDGYITGQVDFQDRPVYATKWLKYGLKSLNIEDDYIIPDIDDEYSNLFWMDYTDKDVSLVNTSQQFKDYPYLGWARRHTLGIDIPDDYLKIRYPMSWEANASQANYDKVSIVSDEYFNRKISPTHVWSAAEMFLYLIDKG